MGLHANGDSLILLDTTDMATITMSSAAIGLPYPLSRHHRRSRHIHRQQPIVHLSGRQSQAALADRADRID